MTVTFDGKTYDVTPWTKERFDLVMSKVEGWTVGSTLEEIKQQAIRKDVREGRIWAESKNDRGGIKLWNAVIAAMGLTF